MTSDSTFASTHVLLNGTPVRSYMDQRDLAHWPVTLMTRSQSNQAYNVGSDIPVTIAEFAHRVGGLLTPDKPVNITGVPTAAQNFRNRYVPSILKARAELGFDLSHSLDNAIKAIASHAFL